MIRKMTVKELHEIRDAISGRTDADRAAERREFEKVLLEYVKNDPDQRDEAQ